MFVYSYKLYRSLAIPKPNIMNLLIIRSKLFAAFICLIVLSSCNNFGKKVTFPGNKGEVFYKGDGVTETDAKAVGKFLEEQQFFTNDDKKRSVQISKDSDRIKVRFVVDVKVLATVENADHKFAILGSAMSKEVFNNVPVDVIYTDDVFKDIKTIPYQQASVAETNIYDEVKQMQHKDYNKNKLYYSKDVSDEEAASITNYLIKSSFFSAEGTNVLILTKMPDKSAYFRFPIKTSFANEEGLQKVDDFGKNLKKDLFAGIPLQLEALDENMKHIKTFNY